MTMTRLEEAIRLIDSKFERFDGTDKQLTIHGHDLELGRYSRDALQDVFDYFSKVPEQGQYRLVRFTGATNALGLLNDDIWDDILDDLHELSINYVIPFDAEIDGEVFGPSLALAMDAS